MGRFDGIWKSFTRRKYSASMKKKWKQKGLIGHVSEVERISFEGQKDLGVVINNKVRISSSVVYFKDCE